jgi:hypothetical protein
MAEKALAAGSVDEMTKKIGVHMAAAIQGLLTLKP